MANPVQLTSNIPVPNDHPEPSGSEGGDGGAVGWIGCGTGYPVPTKIPGKNRHKIWMLNETTILELENGLGEQKIPKNT